MVQNTTGTIVGSDLSEIGGVHFGTIIVETQDESRLKFQITKETTGSVPHIGSSIAVEYVGDEILRAVRIEILQVASEKKKLEDIPSLSEDQISGTALERGLSDVIVIAILQAIASSGALFTGVLLMGSGAPIELSYLYLALGLAYLVIAGGLFLVQTWSYTAALLVNVFTCWLLFAQPLFMIPPIIVVIWLTSEQVRLNYEK